MYRLKLMAAAMVVAGAGTAMGANPAATTAPAEALSPAVQHAIADLSADDFKTRQEALGKLELALGRQMQALVASEDPEVQSRLTTLLEFNDGLTRWVLDAMKLPADQRKALLDFGLRPEVLPVMANVFSPEVEKRVEGVKALGKMDSPEATVMLARLLDDPERPVYVAAMEAVWDKKPTDAIVDALWNRAVESAFGGMRQQTAVQNNVAFRGKPVGGVGVVFVGGGVYRGQDSSIACDVLINLKAPQVDAKLGAFMESLEKTAVTNPWQLSGQTEPMKNVYRLIEAYQPKEALQVLYRLATAPLRQRMQGKINTESYFWSNRTAALATLVNATGQKVEDYQLKRMTPMGGMWTVPAEEDENNAVKKLQEWSAANGGKFGLPTGEAATQPQPEPAPAAAPPGGNNLPAGPAMKMQGVIQGGGIQIQIGPAPADNNK